MKISIINYGVGNLGSVYRSFENLKTQPELISNPKEIKNSQCLILPGVGNFKKCKKILDNMDWTSYIIEAVVEKKKPILGICLGMQLLADFGYEGLVDDYDTPTPGLGLIHGKVKKLKSIGCKKRVPHMGWNSIENVSNSSLFKNIPNGTDFYFVHSYGFIPKCKENIFAITDYSIPITAVVGRENIWGTQFHPEKSSKAGLHFLKNFINLALC